MPPAGGAPKSGRLFRQTHSAPGETPPRQEIDRPHLPAGKFTPQESPQDKPGEGKFPSGGCARPSLCSKSLRPGLRPHDRKPTPPGRNTNRSTQAGPRYTESRYRPFPQRNMFRPAPSAVHVPSSHGKTPSPIPRREGCGIFSLPEGREQKKALQEDEVRLKAAGL